jgi:hypothetical protein
LTQLERQSKKNGRQPKKNGKRPQTKLKWKTTLKKREKMEDDLKKVKKEVNEQLCALVPGWVTATVRVPLLVC